MVGGPCPARVAAPLESPADRPLRLTSSTKYVSGRGEPEASGAGSASVKVPLDPGSNCNVVIALHRVPVSLSLRQMRAAIGTSITTLSVVFLGSVQVSA